jgi:hypothetical protein
MFRRKKMDQKIGSVGTASETASVAGEKAQAQMNVGPLKVAVSVELDNRALIELVASKVPGGAAHDVVIGLEAVLFPAAAPSA